MSETLTEAQIGYFAGFFDGEGWIGIVRRDSTSAAGKKYLVYTLMIGAAQCDPRPVLLLQKHFGGSISRGLKKRSRTPIYTWQVASIRAESFLRLVQAHLIHKREQCEVALSYREFVSSRRRYGPVKNPPEYHEISREYADLIKRVRAETRTTTA